jgi:hypothetical protein
MTSEDVGMALRFHLTDNTSLISATKEREAEEMYGSSVQMDLILIVSLKINQTTTSLGLQLGPRIAQD